MTNKNEDISETRLDALLASRPVVPQKDFADSVFAAIAAGEGDALDLKIDACFAAKIARTHAGHTEKFLAGIVAGQKKVILFRRVFAWSGFAVAAAIAVLVSLNVYVSTPAQSDAEQTVARAVAADPELAALLRNDAFAASPAQSDAIRETAALGSRINDNAIAWLDTLTTRT